MKLSEEDKWRETYPFSVPAVREIHQQVVARLEALGWPNLAPFFTQLLERFARWTMDLPASESYHHPYPFGLLVHSVEAVDRAFAIGAHCIRWLSPPWLKVLLSLALYHDCGRLRDFSIRDPNSGDLWNPFSESLFDFRENRYLPLTGGGDVQWRRGRGIDGHEHRGSHLLPILLPREHGAEIDRLLDGAFYQYIRRSWLPLEILDVHRHVVTEVVAAADQSSVLDDRFRRCAGSRKGTPDIPFHAPVRYNSLNTPARLEGDV